MILTRAFYSLKIYRYQLIRDHKLPEEASTSEGEHGATASGEEHGATAASGEHGTATPTGEGSSTSEHPASASSGTEHGTTGSEGTSTETAPSAHESVPASHDTSTETVHSKAKRAILMVSNDYVYQDTVDYNPMQLAQQMKEQQELQQQNSNHWPNATEHWTTWCKYMAASLLAGTLQMISAPSDDYESIQSGDHKLMRRSEPAVAGAEGSFTDTMTVAENVFVYKTFLIFAGLILVINSLIKALNTRISGTYGWLLVENVICSSSHN